MQTIEGHLPSSTDIAIALSSGVDSNAIGACISKIPSDRKIKAYTLDVPGMRESVDEITTYSRQHNIELEVVDAKSEYLPDLVIEAIRANQSPIYTLSEAYQYKMYKHIAQDGYRVLLTGDGGDEVCAGYDHYFLQYFLQTIKEGFKDKANREIRIKAEQKGTNVISYFKRIQSEEASNKREILRCAHNMFRTNGQMKTISCCLS